VFEVKPQIAGYFGAEKNNPFTSATPIIAIKTIIDTKQPFSHAGLIRPP